MHPAKSLQGGCQEVVGVIDVARVVHVLQDVQQELNHIFESVALGILGSSQRQWESLQQAG